MNNNHHYRFLIMTVFLVLAILIAVLIYTKAVNSPIIIGSLMTKVTSSPTPVKPTFGSITIRNIEETKRHPITDYLMLEILVDSNQLEVVGYDILVSFDPKAFKIIGIESQRPDFTLFDQEKENRLILTGAKKIDAKESSLFFENRIITLTLKPLKAGKYNFELLAEAGKEKTQLVDTGSNVYYPKVNNIEIEIY